MPRFPFSRHKMKMPPLLIGATLLFWGWQTGFLFEGGVMAFILESSRLVKVRWEFSDDEFARVWTFCMVLLLAAMIFAFNNNGGPTDFGQLFQGLNSSSDLDYAKDPAAFYGGRYQAGDGH